MTMNDDDLRQAILQIADMLGLGEMAEEEIRRMDEDLARIKHIMDTVEETIDEANRPSRMRGHILPWLVWNLVQDGVRRGDGDEFMQGLCNGLAALEDGVGEDVYHDWYVIMDGLREHMEMHEQVDKEHGGSGFPDIHEN